MVNPQTKMLAMALLAGSLLDYKKPPAPKPMRNCIQCKKPHTHNNCFCSGECCKIWNKEQKAIKMA